jgi:hypothetical protein
MDLITPHMPCQGFLNGRKGPKAMKFKASQRHPYLGCRRSSGTKCRRRRRAGHGALPASQAAHQIPNDKSLKVDYQLRTRGISAARPAGSGSAVLSPRGPATGGECGMTLQPSAGLGAKPPDGRRNDTRSSPWTLDWTLSIRTLRSGSVVRLGIRASTSAAGT